MGFFHAVEGRELRDVFNDVGELDFVLVAVEGLAVGKVLAQSALETEHVIEAARVELKFADVAHLFFFADAASYCEYLFTKVLKMLSWRLTKNRLNFSTWQ